jgi:adenylate cyclase
MPQSTEKLAVLFADVCGSTPLYESLGDDQARRLIFSCINAMTGEIAGHNGRLIKTIGDEVMCIFPSAEDAFQASCAMQSAAANERQLSRAALHVRIGFNYGEVILEHNDVYGNTVNVAARVASITRAGQIMATRAVYDALSIPLRGRMRQILRAELKGLQHQFEIYQVLMEDDSPDNTRVGIPAFRRPTDHAHEMVLRYRDQCIRIDQARREIMLGREESCDLIIHSDLTSRMHCRVELRAGKFVIADQSTNGTYIRSSDGSIVRISREEAVLYGNGSISLGQVFAESPLELIEFSILSPHP